MNSVDNASNVVSGIVNTRMKSIGTFTPLNPFFLAPMEAVNCASYRLLCKQRGAGLVYTDMIDADKFYDYAMEHGPDAAVTYYVNPQKDEYPLTIQLGGAKIPQMLYTIEHVQPHATNIDINIGCPLPYMLGKKGGVYLMKHPDQLYKLISAMRAAIKINFTVKIRAGWDEDSKNAVDIAIGLEKCGVDAIAVHARTRKQGYQDRADWPLVRKVKEAVKVPVILSGDVTNIYMAAMAFAHTKCDFIMCARGAQNNPSLFTQLNKWYEIGEGRFIPSKVDSTYNKSQVDPYADYCEFLRLYKEREKRYKLSELKDHAIWTARECRGNTIIKQKILEAVDETGILQVLKDLRFP